MKSIERAIVLAGDYLYAPQIETTIKSLALYHDNLKIYLFNQDIPQEWFRHISTQLQKTNNKLVDIKLFHPQLSNSLDSQKLPHINYMTYARYFIPEYVDADTVLYLDSDLVVTQNIDELFELDLTDYYIACAPSCFGTGVGANVGVMVVNNKRWKEESVMQKLLDLTAQEFENVPEGDQSIINMLVGVQWLRLDVTYNFQIGYDMGAEQLGHAWIFDIPIDPIPKILHYISGVKPWNIYSNMRLREVWWFYYTLSWETIAHSKLISLDTRFKPEKSFDLQLLTLTSTDMLESIEWLIKERPNYLFHIAAYTRVSDKLTRLLSYDNVRVHQAVTSTLLKMLLNKTDVYLDVSYGEKYVDIMSDFVHETGKPILSFESTYTPDLSTVVIPNDDKQQLLTVLDEQNKKG